MLFTFRVDGAADSPIVFRALDGERATIEGAVVVNAAHNWVWGLEITDPTDIAGNNVGLAAGGNKVSGVPDDLSGIRFINNYIHDIWNNHGMALWNLGSDQLAYGNIVVDGIQDPSTTRRPYGVYTQNDFERYGYKFFTNNIFIDAAKTCERCSNFHGFTRTDHVSGIVLEHNMFISGGVTLGGSSDSPTSNNIIRDNYFYSAFTRFGYHRVFQGRVEDNIFFDSQVSFERLWGDALAAENPDPTITTGNIFASEEGRPLIVRTYVEGQAVGVPRLSALDTFDHNTFYQFDAPLRFLFNFAGSGPTGVDSLAEWQASTELAGNRFDTNSTVEAPPSEPTVFVLSNAYDDTRFHLGIFNWDGRDSAEITLDSLPIGKSFHIFRADDLWGAPIALGRAGQPLTIPLDMGLTALIVQLDA